jgi:hypothetical protein
VTPDAILDAMARIPFPKPEKARLVPPTKTNLRRIGQFSLTDPMLLHRTLSTEAKLALGLSINYPSSTRASSPSRSSPDSTRPAWSRPRRNSKITGS